MTHGVGAISFGGGGGCSSGAASTGVYYNSSRRHTDNDEPFCCALCWLIGCFLCITKMTYKVRIGLVWFYVIGGSTLAGLLINRHLASQSIMTSPTDMIKVDKLSGVLCESVIINSSSFIETFVFNSEPKIDKQKFITYSTFVQSSLESNNYEYWGYYLLEGSIATANICTKSLEVELYIFKGKQNLDSWISDAQCEDCFEERQFIRSCSVFGPQNAKITAKSSDQYYFLFENVASYNRPFVDLTVTFTLQRRQYDIQDATVQCRFSLECQFQLDISGSQSVVIYTPEGTSYDNIVTVYCKTRIIIYILFFAMLPIGLGTVITVGIWRCAGRSKRPRSPSQASVFTVSNNDDQQGFINYNYNAQNAPPSYLELPPKYEDVVRNSTET